MEFTVFGRCYVTLAEAVERARGWLSESCKSVNVCRANGSVVVVVR